MEGKINKAGDKHTITMRSDLFQNSEFREAQQ